MSDENAFTEKTQLVVEAARKAAGAKENLKPYDRVAFDLMMGTQNLKPLGSDLTAGDIYSLLCEQNNRIEIPSADGGAILIDGDEACPAFTLMKDVLQTCADVGGTPAYSNLHDGTRTLSCDIGR